MLASTSFHDEIARPGGEIGILFPGPQQKFWVRQPLIQVQSVLDRNGEIQASAQEQRRLHEDPLVRLPSLRESKWKVIVLQRWVGRVEHVGSDRFLAVLSDATNPRNPPEQIELDRREVSQSDLPLLAEGATFYWSIGYRDTPGGQRERISTLRFARLPRLAKIEVNRIFDEADREAAFLESD
jgi:hypothetical protein